MPISDAAVNQGVNVSITQLKQDFINNTKAMEQSTGLSPEQLYGTANTKEQFQAYLMQHLNDTHNHTGPESTGPGTTEQYQQLLELCRGLTDNIFSEGQVATSQLDQVFTGNRADIALAKLGQEFDVKSKLQNDDSLRSLTLDGVSYTKSAGNPDIIEVRPITLAPLMESGEFRESIDSGNFIEPSSLATQSEQSQFSTKVFAKLKELAASGDFKFPEVRPQSTDIIGKNDPVTITIDDLEYSVSITVPFPAKGSGAVFYQVNVNSGPNNSVDNGNFIVKQMEKGNLGIPEFDDKQHANLYGEIQMLDHMSAHPYSLDFHGAFKSGDSYFVAMQKSEQGDLNTILTQIQEDRTSVSVKDKMLLLFTCAESLATVHKSGQVHGDIKSDNFLVNQLESMRITLMADYGESSYASRESTREMWLQDDKERFAAMAYQMYTGTSITASELKVQLTQQNPIEDPFNALMAKIMQIGVEQPFTMTEAAEALFNMIPKD